MPKGLRPRVNEAREFLEIAKDFKDPKEIIREALSNSWDAGADYVSIRFDLVNIPGTKRKKIVAEISDNGSGMSDDESAAPNESSITSFFNLGDSYKPYGSIGSKGHGTKIFYKSHGISVSTVNTGAQIDAETDVPPWDTLNTGEVPTYSYEKYDTDRPEGTRIRVDGFQAKHKDFKSIDNLSRYIRWYTVMGSFGHYFGVHQSMKLELKPVDHHTPVVIPFGFVFPEEQADLDQGTENICKLYGPKTINCGDTEEGETVEVEIVGALLGENYRDIVPHTYTHMGLWLGRDHIRVERHNKVLEEVFGGQYYYRNFLVFANCQKFDLTANRNNIRTDQEEYDLAVEGIKDFCRGIKDDGLVKEYFDYKKNEENQEKRERRERQQEERKQKAVQKRKDRLNRYRARADNPFSSVDGALRKEPENEAETALILQAMISAGHPGIGFRIGDYNATSGTDLIVELDDKEMQQLRWVELVLSLDRLYKWPHPPEGYHIIVCYTLGDAKQEQTFEDGVKSRLVKKDSPGRYGLFVGSETIDVYVLREILQAHDGKGG